MTTLRFRAPGTPLPLETLLRRAIGDAREAARLLRAGRVRLASRTERDGARRVPGGSRLEVELDGRPPGPARVEPGEGVASGEGWRAVALARGTSAAPRDGETLVLAPDPEAGGLALLATDAVARELRARLAEEPGRLVWRALAPLPPWPAGRLVLEGGEVTFSCVGEVDGVAELALASREPDPARLRGALAAAGAPLLGDARHGGVLVDGGLRLRPARLAIPGLGIDLASPAPPGWLPAETPFAPGAEADGGEPLVVSEATLRALARGHPWILPDRETGDPGRFRPGALVQLRGPRAGVAGLARIEGPGPIAARLWSLGTARPREAASVEARVAKALARRKALLDGADAADGSDAFRLVHGEADGLPGLAVDRLGPILRVMRTGRAAEGFEARALDALLRALAPRLGEDPAVIEAIHLRDRPPGAVTAVHRLRGTLPPALEAGERLVVRERGLRFAVDPGLARPEQPSPGIGLFLDQRENRARLAERARHGGRWLNLFAHTGAFSVALLAAGAEQVTSVDLSAPYLEWLESNLALNALEGDRHRSVKADGRRALERMADGERFDGIVLDPPTAAAAGRRFWSVRKDLPALVAASLRRLSAGGVLLVSRNDRGGRATLETLVRRAAEAEGVALRAVDPAPAGEDFPRLDPFPEGDPFEAVLAVRE